MLNGENHSQLKQGIEGAVIVGCGIAGLAAALYAQQRRIQIPIYEKKSSLESQSHLLWIAPNGLELLASLGLLNEIRTIGIAQKNMSFTDKKLTPLMNLDCDKLTSVCGYPIVAVKRNELYQLLLDRFLKLGGMIHFDHSLMSLEESDNDVILKFENGRVVNAPFVIGADGISSKCRNILFPESKLKYQGLRAYLGVSEIELAKKYVGKTFEIWGNGTRFVLTSLNGKHVFWSALERSETYLSNHLPIEKNILSYLSELFVDYHSDVVKVINHAEFSSIHRVNFGVVSHLNKRFIGRVCIIGDAAHGMPPNMGQGASLALEDAYDLIHQLCRTENLSEALLKHERNRVPRSNTMIRIANAMNTVFQPKSKIGSWLRNITFFCLPDFLTQYRAQNLYRLPFHIPIQETWSGPELEILSKPKWRVKFILKLLVYFLRIKHRNLKAVILDHTHINSCAKLLTTQFMSSEPLSYALKINSNELYQSFVEILKFVSSQKIGMVLVDNTNIVRAVVTVEDYFNTFQTTNVYDQGLKAIGALLGCLKLPEHLTPNKQGVVYECGLAATDYHTTGKDLVMMLSLEHALYMLDRGYRLGFCKVTNPALSRRFRFPRFLGRVFKLAHVEPSNFVFNSSMPFKNNPSEAVLIAWVFS